MTNNGFAADFLQILLGAVQRRKRRKRAQMVFSELAESSCHASDLWHRDGYRYLSDSLAPLLVVVQEKTHGHR